MVNETDPNSVTGYTPVPLASMEGRAFETSYILDTPSPSNSIVSIDKNPLSPGETATDTMVLRDINNTPLELTHDLMYGAISQDWSLTVAKPTGKPGEYTASVTYTGGQNSSPVYAFPKDYISALAKYIR